MERRREAASAGPPSLLRVGADAKKPLIRQTGEVRLASGSRARAQAQSGAQTAPPRSARAPARIMRESGSRPGGGKNGTKMDRKERAMPEIRRRKNRTAYPEPRSKRRLHARKDYGVCAARMRIMTSHDISLRSGRQARPSFRVAAEQCSGAHAPGRPDGP